MGNHKTMNMTGHWDMTPRVQVEAMTGRRSAVTASFEIVKSISRCLLEGRMGTVNLSSGVKVTGFKKD